MKPWLIILLCVACGSANYAYDEASEAARTAYIRTPSSLVLPSPSSEAPPEAEPSVVSTTNEGQVPDPQVENPTSLAVIPLVSPSPTVSVRLSPSPTPEPIPTPEIPISINKDDRIICNPFGSAGHTTNIWGLIHYIPSACIQSRFPQKNGALGKELIVEHFIPGHPQAFPCLMRSEAKIGLSHLNVIPAAFDKGFKSTKGDLVVDRNNKPIFEFFSLTLYGALQLGPDDKPGLYQLAILSDDGSLLHVGKHPGPYQTIISNNNTHPPRTRCSSLRTPLELTHNMKVDFKLEYFQGPRTMVSLMFFWRPVTPDTKEDRECSLDVSAMVNTNDMTIFPNVMAAFYQRGWKLLQPENFHKFEMEEKACEALKTGPT